MRKIFKNVLVILLAFSLILSSAAVAFAADSKLDNLGVPLENVGDMTEELLSITIVPDGENKLLNAFSEISRGRTIAGFARKLMSFASELRPDINRAPKVIDSQIDNTSVKREKVYEEDSIHVNQ